MPSLTGVRVSFHTHDDNKDFDTVLHVFVKNRLATTAGSEHNTDFVSNLLGHRRYLAGGDLSDHTSSPYLAFGIGLAADTDFGDPSTHEFDLTLMPQPVTTDDIVLPVLDVHVQPNGNDRWIFDYTVAFTFDDGSGFSCSSKESGIPGIIRDQDNRNYSGMCAENPLGTLPVFERPVTNAVLKRISLDFVTHDDNKDHDTRLDVRIANRLNAGASQDIATGENLFPDKEFVDGGPVHTVTWSSDDEPGTLPLTEISLADIVLPEVDINIDPNGNDRWIFDYRLTLEFADPADFAGKRATYTSRTSGVILDQDNNRHLGVYQGPSLPTVAARTAPPLSDVPPEQVTRTKSIPLPLIRRKFDEFINQRNGADDTGNPPLRRVRIDNTGKYNDDTLPETYYDLRAITAARAGVAYVSNPASIGQLTKLLGLGDIYIRDINSATLGITVDAAQPAPFSFKVEFETGGPEETTGGVFTNMDFLEFSITLKLTLALGTTVDESGTERPVVDVLHWITELQDLDKTREIDHVDPDSNVTFYHYKGTFLGQPVDLVSSSSAYGLFIEDVLQVHLVTSSAFDPGGFFRQETRDRLYDTLIKADKLTGRAPRDGINSTVTSWLLGGVADDTPDIDGNDVVLTDVHFQNDAIQLSYSGPRKAFLPVVPADWPTAQKPSPAWDFTPGTLANIDHIVVLMMENRSFDHMLGYLSLPVDQGGAGRADIDGLKGTESNSYRGTTFPVFPLTDPFFSPDPPHGFDPVHRAIDGGRMDGFVKSMAEQNGAASAGAIMGHHTARTVPVYDALARDFAVGHRWFSSHPGPTFCNRFYELTGRLNLDSHGFWEFDNPSPPRPEFTDTIFDHLTGAVDPATQQPVTWSYFEQGYCFLRLFERHTFDDKEHIFDVEDPDAGFFAKAAAGTLPNVSFVEPRFVELPPGNNCDGPPSDVTGGQNLVKRVVDAVVAGPSWEKTMLVIIYDEHGGFYDHVPPSAATRVSPELPITTHGPRVPAFVVSPWVGAGTVFGHDAPAPGTRRNDLHFDHTSILKTIVRRFLSSNPPYMGARYADANDLSAVLGTRLRRSPFRPFIPYTFQYGATSSVRLAVHGTQTAPGAELWLVANDGSTAEDFSFEAAGDDSFYIRSHVSNLYLTAHLANPAQASSSRPPIRPSVIQDVKYPHRPPHGTATSDHQKWTVTAVHGGGHHERDHLYVIRNRAFPGLVLQPSDPRHPEQPGPVVLDRSDSHHGVEPAPWQVTSLLLSGV
jgi:phospholipase C